MGKARFNYVRRNERVVRAFTTRQKEIIGGYSKTSPSKRELTVIISKAKELLRTTNMAIGDIAMAVGYANATVLIKIFKKITNTTPGAYRKRVYIHRDLA